MYSLNIPVAQLRTKMRQEFERHRYVNQITVVDMLLFQSHAEYQVRGVHSLDFEREMGLSWFGLIHRARKTRRNMLRFLDEAYGDNMGDLCVDTMTNIRVM
jgi:hypothetical protein